MAILKPVSVCASTPPEICLSFLSTWIHKLINFQYLQVLVAHSFICFPPPPANIIARLRYCAFFQFELHYDISNKSIDRICQGPDLAFIFTFIVISSSTNNKWLTFRWVILTSYSYFVSLRSRITFIIHCTKISGTLYNVTTVHLWDISPYLYFP